MTSIHDYGTARHPISEMSRHDLLRFSVACETERQLRADRVGENERLLERLYETLRDLALRCLRDEEAPVTPQGGSHGTL